MHDKVQMYGTSGKYYFAGKLPHGVSGGAVTLAVLAVFLWSLECMVKGIQVW
jgi:hypothetical protein